MANGELLIANYQLVSRSGWGEFLTVTVGKSLAFLDRPALTSQSKIQNRRAELCSSSAKSFHPKWY
ncbi:hypothetical protein Ple7327_3428 [Pleurocapsa sp. PCC 7327]|nr:hypothetical protein Ple7327_3428 [Pleurocapsa sp. PCC 7327]